MSKPVTPGWPEASAAFMPFPLPGITASPTSPMPGLSGGLDLIRDFWSKLSGGAALPGFMLPTVDVEELDKRIGDLKAAEQWIEVNLGMLRATIQGLEVQRHTIAAIQSLTTPLANASTNTATPSSPAGSPAWPTPSTPQPSSAAAPASSLAAASAPNEWLAHLQAQFTKVAEAVMTPAVTPPPTESAPPRKKLAKKSGTRARKTASR